VLRINGKYFQQDYRPAFAAAEAAFQRAFALSPDLALTHHLYVYLEVETGRAREALMRIANRLQREPNQPELLAALCQAARYCGLLDVSLAASERAKELDPHVRTSAANTYLALLDYPKLLASTRSVIGSMAGIALLELGAGVDEARRSVESEFVGVQPDSPSALFRDALIATITGDRHEVLRTCEAMVRANENYPDGEAIYTVTRMLARAGWRDFAMKGMRMTVDAGFTASWTFDHDPWVDSLRDLPEFQELLARARERYLAADAAFQTAGGYRLLGVAPKSGSGKGVGSI
jgi:hypothetical protein